MAANFWTSSQKSNWLLTRDKLAELRRGLEEEDSVRGLTAGYPLPDFRHLNIYFHSLILRLGRRMNIRQQALATAELYLKRFLTRVSVRETNVYLVLSTCVYLACKIEECPQHIRTVVSEARAMFQDFVTADTTKLAECEFHLISELNSYLIIHHPYRTISELQGPLKLTSEEMVTAWSFVNDSYMTDLLLLYPPHIVGLTAIFLSVLARNSHSQAAGINTSGIALPNSTIIATNSHIAGSTNPPGGSLGAVNAMLASPNNRTNHMIEWFAESCVDIEAVIECTQEIISLYDTWEGQSDKICKEQISRIIRGRF